MQALENTGRRSWVNTYPLCPNARMDEQNHQVQSRNGVIRLLGWNQYPQTSTAAANNRRNDRKCVQARGNSHMRRLKLLSLLSISSLALLVSGCGGGNSIGHTTQTTTFDNPGTQTVGVSLTLSATANSGLTVSFTSATPTVCTISGTPPTLGDAGTCTIDASVAGNSTYAAASQIAQSFTVNPAISPNTTIYITGYALTANSSGGPGNNLPEIWKQLVWISGNRGVGGLSYVTYTVSVYEEFQRHNRSFQDVTAYMPFFGDSDYKLTGRGEPRQLAGVMVAQNFFPTLGVKPALGRLFTPEECQKGGRPAVLLGHFFWQRQFAADPAIVGQAIILNNRPVTVVGVLPASFDFASVFSPGLKKDIYVPGIMDVMRDWGNTLTMMGRLKPGVTVVQAQAETEVLMPQLRAAHKEWFMDYTATADPVLNGAGMTA